MNPCWKSQWEEAGFRFIHIRRNCTLWFWRHKNFATSNWLSKTKQRERLMRCNLYTTPLASIGSSVIAFLGILYTYISVGLSALLVSTIRAMRRPLWRGTSDRIDSTLFRMYKSKLLTVQTGAIGHNYVSLWKSRNLFLLTKYVVVRN